MPRRLNAALDISCNAAGQLESKTGHRANFVVIRDGLAVAFEDQWAALGCAYMIADGPDAAEAAIGDFEPTSELMDWSFAEGGYLLDYDKRLLIVFGPLDEESEEFEELEELEDATDEELEEKGRKITLKQFKELLESSAINWSGWMLRWDDRGVDAFAEHLTDRGISSIRFQMPSHPTDCGLLEYQA